MTKADLLRYRVAEREPLRARIGDYEVVTMPPPSSGGVCTVEALNVLYCLARGVDKDVRGLRADGRFEAALVRSFKHAFADRARWLGDPDFTQVPTARLTNREYACELAAKTADESEAFGSVRVPEDGGTSHLCVADRFGNVVAWTETINGSFGSLVVVEPYGIILNNEMDDFLTVRGEANLYGLRQGEANLVGPGKRPLSSMSPTIVVKDGRPVLALGASGGPRIITAVTQVILNVMEFEQSLGEAITAVRLHHQWQPDEVYFDGAPPEQLVAALKAAGEKVSERRKGAAVQAIRFLEDGTMTGASDPRKGGRPVGVP
jgi:gamma-glutamyltranspeptidase/glutathione hydrolase